MSASTPMGNNMMGQSGMMMGHMPSSFPPSSPSSSSPQQQQPGASMPMSMPHQMGGMPFSPGMMQSGQHQQQQMFGGNQLNINSSQSAPQRGYAQQRHHYLHSSPHLMSYKITAMSCVCSTERELPAHRHTPCCPAFNLQCVTRL
jgi:hypothetical protein